MNKSIPLILTFCGALLASPFSLASERAEQGWALIEKGAMVVDVRTPEEFAEGHLENAVNFPLSSLGQYVHDLDKDAPLVLYCRSGRRSGAAYQYLVKQGFTNLHNAGGYEEMISVR